MIAALVALALLLAFFILRHEIWTRVFLTAVDPRPAGLLRVAFGGVVLWTFLCLAPSVRLFFSDEGLLLPAMARDASRSPLRQLWDPVHGFEHWWSPLQALLGSSSILQLRSDPPLTFAVYGLALVSAALMTLGVWTTVTTAATWFLGEQLYRYDAMFTNGGDLVIRAFLFLAIFCRWGEAYSVDAWRRRRRELLGGASGIPPLCAIPAWPLRLMMVQLALIYFLNGWHKTGEGWREGSALYYALNLDHFYRFPAQGVVASLQQLGVLPLATWITRGWELCFPLALLGAALRGYEADRRAGTWPTAGSARRIASWLLLAAAGAAAAAAILEPLPALATGGAALVLLLLYRTARARFPGVVRFVLDWVLGKRIWLVFGLALHLGIDLGMNIGTFPQVMMAVYLAWLSAPEIEALWRVVLRRATPVTVRYHPDEASVRQAALLRLREHGPIEFVADSTVEPRSLHVDSPARSDGLRGAEAALALVPVFPALWWLRPFRRLAPLRGPAGRLALRRLGSKA